MANQFISDPKDVELEEAVNREIRQLGFHMHVRARGGHVTISGTADDYATKREIMSVVRGISGVREVTNNIRVAFNAD